MRSENDVDEREQEKSERGGRRERTGEGREGERDRQTE